LPGLKRLIETLFERGLCRVVFATETMSLGIHMPARAVVLQGVTKRTDRGFRSLTHNELTQMAGRAGRRGIDPEGQCVIALDARGRRRWSARASPRRRAAIFRASAATGGRARKSRPAGRRWAKAAAAASARRRRPSRGGSRWSGARARRAWP